MKLNISHVTQYNYTESVSDSVNEIRLTPSTNDRQSCYHHAILIEPNASLYSYEDYFGNRVHAFAVNPPHKKLTIRTQMTVVTQDTPSPEQYAASVRLRPAQAWNWLTTDDAANRFTEYLLPTEYTSHSPEVAVYAASVVVQPGKPVREFGIYEWLYALSKKIRSEFIYDTEATNVKTKVRDMIVCKRGVCQDFAHLMIACSRSFQIPARYVSGYHFVGDLQGGSADFEQASHAWVEAYVPGLGWCSFDPTNDAPVGERYVKLGHGRDYKDIVPVKGVYFGGGTQELHVAVDVRKMEE